MFYVTLMKYNSITPAAPTTLGGGQLCWAAISQFSEHLENFIFGQAEILERHLLCRCIKCTTISKHPQMITTFWDLLMYLIKLNLFWRKKIQIAVSFEVLLTPCPTNEMGSACSKKSKLSKNNYSLLFISDYLLV